MAYKSTNPYTGKVVAEFETLTDEQLEAKLQKAQKAFESWRNTSFAKRAAIIHRAAELIMERREQLGAINTIETGKPLQIAIWENNLCADIMNYYADNAEELLKPHFLETKDQMSGHAIGIYQPLGIIYEIEPWNVPFFQMSRPTAAQLMAGNVVVLKHASNCPQCAMAMEQLLKDAGLPEGCFQNLFVNYEQSDKLIDDPRICGVTITGSTEVGRGVAARSGRALKKHVMELGGSDPMIVLSDADMQKVIQGALLGRLTISGQVCASDKRMFVHESLYDAFIGALQMATQQLVVGDPLDINTTFGPLCSKKAADKVRSQIQKAVEHGATAIEIGPEVPADSSFVRATILTGVTENNPIFGEEIFGPVLMVFSWNDEQEALRLANATSFGLGGSVYTESPVNAARVAAAIESGAISINQPTMASPSIPFGGIKESGYGRELGSEGIREFTNMKYINSAAIDIKAVFEAVK